MVFTSISIANNTVSKSIMFMNFRASLKTHLHIFEWLMYPSSVCYFLLIGFVFNLSYGSTCPNLKVRCDVIQWTELRYNEGSRDLQKFVRYNEVSFLWGSFSYILLLLGWQHNTSFLTPIRSQNGGDRLELVWWEIVPRGSSRRSLLFFVLYFSARLDFPSPPSAPGSPRMRVRLNV